MIHDPFAILVVLLAIEGGVLFLADHPRTKRFFKYLPSMFWMYFLPMLANTAGLIDAEKGKPLLDALGAHCLPAALFLLLIAVDVVAIARLGPVALGVMLAGSAGIVLGGPAIVAMFHHWLPDNMWKGIGALSASWVGGSANMIAVAKATGTPGDVFTPVQVVDTIVPYTWMGIMIALAGFQGAFDRWCRADHAVLEHLKRNSATAAAQPQPLTLRNIAVLFALAAAATLASMHLANLFPVNKGLAEALTIVFVTTLAIGLSFTPLRRLEGAGASRLGYALLYLVLTAIGAKANLSCLAAAPLLIVAGFVWIAIHVAFLVGAGKLLRAPMSLLAAASQANVGGPASAPVVAEIYHTGLAPVGLLLAILGNILGTYTGLLCSWMCEWANQL